MRGQVWYISLLIGLMCLVRFSLSAVGYAEPLWLLEQMNMTINSDAQLSFSYLVRVWAIRDIVIAVVVASASRSVIKTLLLACVVIDTTDMLSAYLSGFAGLSDTFLAAIAALIPEVIALALLYRQKSDNQDEIVGKKSGTAV